MKLAEQARKKGISYITAYRQFKEGKLPCHVYQTKSGTILVEEQQNYDNLIRSTLIYCRVSSYSQKNDLDRQIQRCKEFCESNGWVVNHVYKEIASGMNDNRRELNNIFKILSLDKPIRIVVEHKDRFTRYGFNFLDIILPKLNCEIVVINRDETNEADMMKDFISTIYSFCAKMYGIRRCKNKLNKIKEIITE